MHQEIFKDYRSMTTHGWRRWTSRMLNSNTISCNISFEIALETRIYKVSLQIRLNMKTTSRRPKPDSCQTQQHTSHCLNPDIRQTHPLPDLATDVPIEGFVLPAARPRHRRPHSRVCTSCCQNRHRQEIIWTSSARTDCAVIQLSTTNTDYCIRSNNDTNTLN
jgi:hypothetical protein